MRSSSRPAQKFDSLHESQPVVAAALEECLDWIEAEFVDVRARRRQFSNGIWTIVRAVVGGRVTYLVGARPTWPARRPVPGAGPCPCDARIPVVTDVVETG